MDQRFAMPALLEEISTITAKGQTTVPKSVRQALGVDYGGRIAFRQGADWRLTGQLDRFQLIDRSEALIVASGPWSLASATNKLVLGGDLVLDNTRIGIPVGTNRGDVLRVREINRPVSLGAVASTHPASTTEPANHQSRTFMASLSKSRSFLQPWNRPQSTSTCVP